MLMLCIENVLNNLKKEFLKTINFIDFWCPHTDSNREPIDYKSKSFLKYPLVNVDIINF